MKLESGSKNFLLSQAKRVTTRILRKIRRETNGLLPGYAGLPGLLIVGAQKAGTSALYRYLTHHPEVYSARKEVNYFKYHYARGRRFYKRQFLAGPGLKVDATPGYLYHQEVPARAAQLLRPDTKIIVLLRNPVDRAYSAWNMYRTVCKDPQMRANFLHSQNTDPTIRFFDEYCTQAYPSFSDAIARELEWLHSASPVREPSLLRRGFYTEQIQHWLNYFPLQNFTFIESSELKDEESARVVLSNLEKQLNLSAGGFDNLSFELVHTRAYERPIPEDLRIELGALFRKHNRGLEELTGLNPSWNKQ